MESLLFHPKTVHIPMALGVLMPLVAGGVLLAWWRGWLSGRSWIVVVALQAILLGSGIVALQTGEVEEERVEAAVPEASIEAHEEAAELFVWGSGAVLALMAVPLFFTRRRAGPPLAAIAFLGTLFVLALGYRTGEAGGRLVYEQGAAQVYAGGAGPPGAAEGGGYGEHEEEEDDD